MGVTQLRKDLVMPPRTMAEGIGPAEERETPWCSKLKPRRVTPNPNVTNLQEQCFYTPPRHKKKAKIPPPADAQQENVHEVTLVLLALLWVEKRGGVAEMPFAGTNKHNILQHHHQMLSRAKVDSKPLNRGGADSRNSDFEPQK
uniref:Uncharacterized protein n=1 Tax=Eutreptiella gymnastica TaxID=73025 RepID=A0A7S4LB83_9EUGL